MKNKEEPENTAKPDEPKAEPNDQDVESLIDIGPEAEALASEADESEPVVKEAKTPEQQEIVRLNDRFLRLQADFDNFRKRTLRERDDLQKRAGEAVLSDLIPILDNLEFGLQQALAKPGGESFVEGLKMIQTQLVEMAKKHGLESVSALGKAFDPREHEAVVSAPSDEVPEGFVVMQTRRGYRLGDRLLRPVMVVVSSGPANSGNQSGEG